MDPNNNETLSPFKVINSSNFDRIFNRKQLQTFVETVAVRWNS